MVVVLNLTNKNIKKTNKLRTSILKNTILLILLLQISMTSQAQWTGPTSGMLTTTNYVNISGTMVTGLPGGPPPPPIFQVKSMLFIGAAPTYPLTVDHGRVDFNNSNFYMNTGTQNYFVISPTSILFKDATQDLFKVDANGYIYARKAIVTLTNPYPDYVFEKDYKLPTINELDLFIKKYHHLPNVPSLAEVEANNKQIDIGEMQVKLLEKVEELTLYIIAQQKQIDAMKLQLDNK